MNLENCQTPLVAQHNSSSGSYVADLTSQSTLTMNDQRLYNLESRNNVLMSRVEISLSVHLSRNAQEDESAILLLWMSVPNEVSEIGFICSLLHLASSFQRSFGDLSANYDSILHQSWGDFR